MTNVIEGFLVDQAFIDRTQTVHGMLSSDPNQICSFTPNGTTFFNTPTKLTDSATAAQRSVAWVASTVSSLIVDTTVYPLFSTLTAEISKAQQSAIFRVLDRLAFRNNPTVAIATIDAELSVDTTLTGLYVAGSCSRSTVFTPTVVWLDNATQYPCSVPNFVQFDMSFTIGETQTVVTFLIYLNCDSFTQNYSMSTVKVVVPPLPYDTLLNSPVKSSVGNVFSTATMTANLAYSTQNQTISKSTISGELTFNVTLVDGTDTVDVPFTLWYKGKAPTVSQIRDAIRSALTASGVGTQAQWQARTPGLYIIARFYLFPLWDKVIAKDTVNLYQPMVDLKDIIALNKTAMAAAGLTVDIATEGLFQSGYNQIVLLTVPDASYVPMDTSLVGSKYLTDYFPDYQACTSVDPVYALLNQDTQSFIARLNTLLAKAAGATSTDTTATVTEGQLIYYSITIGEIEMCLITKECYQTLIKEQI